MANAEHIERQKAARDAKAKRKQARMADANSACFLRAVRNVEIPKADLLAILKKEGFIPLDATVIVATGHRPDVLTISYSSWPASSL